MPDQVKTAAELLAASKSLFILTGAGISAESKIPIKAERSCRRLLNIWKGLQFLLPSS